MEPERPAVRAFGRGSGRVRPRAVPAVRRVGRGPGGAPGQPGGHLHGAGAAVRVRAWPGSRAQVRGGDVMTDGAGVIGAGPVRGRGRATRAAVRAGLNHGWIELSHCFTMLEDAFEILSFTLASVVVLLAVGSKHVHLPGTHFPISSTILA